MKQLTAKQIADLVGGTLEGAADVTVDRVQSLKEAGGSSVSFLGNEKYTPQVAESQAAVVLVPESFPGVPREGGAWVRCENASAAFSKLVDQFAPPPVEFPPGCHPTSVVAADAIVAETAFVGAHAVIESGVRIGEHTVIGAQVYIGHDAVIGCECNLYPQVTVRERCILGDRVFIHSGSVIGSDGFGYISGPEGHEKIPQVGIVQIDDDVEIGANVAVDRARFGRTWIKQGTKIDNLVQIAHNVVIGEHCILVGQSGIAGSSELGRGVILAGQAALAGHVSVGDGTIVMGKSGVTKNLPAGAVVMGFPAIDRKEHARDLMSMRSVPKMKRQLKELSQEVESLRRKLDDLLESEDR